MGQTRPLRLRYTRPALADLGAILDYIADRSPQSARRVQLRIQAVISLLVQYPLIGRRTNDPVIRRISTTPYPVFDFLRGDPSRGHNTRDPTCGPRPVEHARFRLISRSSRCESISRPGVDANRSVSLGRTKTCSSGPPKRLRGGPSDAQNFYQL